MIEQSAEQLVMLSVPPTLEEPIADWLMEQHPDIGFTSVASHGHGADHSILSAVEQVTGKQRRVEIQLIIPAQLVDELLRGLQAQFTNADVHYWVMPVIESGELSDR